MKLGETRVTVRVHGNKGYADVDMLVDTGSTLTKIPESVAKKIGIEASETVEVELADGSLRDRGEAQTEMEIFGRRRIVPLLVGPDGEEPLLGLTTLEIFRLKVNPAAQRLEPSKWIEYAVSA